LTNSAKWQEDPQDAFQTVYLEGIDDQYIPSFQLELLGGRNFDKSFGYEEQNVIINEVAMKQFGFVLIENALNGKVNLGWH